MYFAARVAMLILGVWNLLDLGRRRLRPRAGLPCLCCGGQCCGECVLECCDGQCCPPCNDQNDCTVAACCEGGLCDFNCECVTIAGQPDPPLCSQEPPPPDPGIVVFLNNDDDNQNGIVDHEEHDPFQDGQGAVMDDDELVAVSVSCTVSGFITVAAYDARIGLYSSQDKAEELPAWTCWSDCRAGCRPMSEWTGEVYVEGREGSGSLADIALTASCGSCDENFCAEQARLTVVRVERLYWDEHQFAAQNTPLDWCENNDGRRIFPDLLFPGDTQGALRRKVDLVAEVKPAVEGVEVFFRVWDVDDPFDQLNAGMPDVALIDPTNPTNGPDNRPGPEAPWSTSAMTWANGKAAIPYTVALQPGNNYRAGAALTYGALGQNTIRNGQTLDPQQQADALNARFPPSPGSWEGYELPLTWSEMLTVWRKLHVETDSMGPVTGNEIITNITDFVGTGTAVTQVTVAVSLDDGSANLDSSPPGNGRFENGHLFVGSGGTDIRIDSLIGNGNSRVVFASTSFAGQPFQAMDNDDFSFEETIGGTIIKMKHQSIGLTLLGEGFRSAGERPLRSLRQMGRPPSLRPAPWPSVAKSMTTTMDPCSSHRIHRSQNSQTYPPWPRLTRLPTLRPYSTWATMILVSPSYSMSRLL